MQGKSKQRWGLGAAFLLGACSGGGGGSSVTTPPPPPPAPTAFPLTSSDSLQAISVTQSSTATAPPASNVTAGSAALDAAGTVSVDYDATSGTYTVHGTPGSASFTAADRTDSSGYIDTYSRQSGTVTDQLRLFGNIRSGGPQAGAPVQLTYLSYGVWTHSDSQSGQMQRSYALFGFPTATGGMPRSGLGSYQTAVTGSMVQVGVFNSDIQVGGTASFDVDFGAGTINTDLALTTGSNVLGTFNGSGTISGSQFSGSFTTSNVADFVGGAFKGGFYGPAAQEMGYAFTIKEHNPDPFASASPAPTDTLISGVVVGKK